MAKWERTGNQLVIIQGKMPGCVYVGVLVLGILMLLAGCSGAGYQLFMYFTKEKIALDAVAIFGFFLVMGVIAFSGSLPHLGKSFKEKILFDAGSETVRFTVPSIAPETYDLPYSEISHVHTYRDTRASRNSNYSVYMIYLIKKDGAEVWITQYVSDPKSFTELATAIADFTGFAVLDNSELIAPRNAARTYKSGGERRRSCPTTPFLSQTAVPEGDAVTLRKPRFSPGAAVATVSFLLLFTVFPVVMLIDSVRQKQTGELIVAIVFMLFFYALILLVLLMVLKDTRLTIRGDGITVELLFRAFRFMNKKIFIPSQRVKYVRVNRGEEGYFTLSLGLDPATENVDGIFGFLASLSAAGAHDITGRFIRKEKEVPLWYLMNSSRAGDGPNIYDLLYLENMIERRLKLTEAAINIGEAGGRRKA